MPSEHSAFNEARVENLLAEAFRHAGWRGGSCFTTKAKALIYAARRVPVALPLAKIGSDVSQITSGKYRPPTPISNCKYCDDPIRIPQSCRYSSLKRTTDQSGTLQVHRCTNHLQRRFVWLPMCQIG